MLAKTRASVSLRFSSLRARSRTLAKRSLGKDVEALLVDRLLAAELGLGVAQRRVVEVRVAGLALRLVEVGGEVLGDEPVEEHAEHVGLEVPAVDAAAQVVGDPPDGLVQLCALGFLALLTTRCGIHPSGLMTLGKC